jgi:hypothetical protein
MKIKNISKRTMTECLEKKQPFNCTTKEGAVTFMPGSKLENPTNLKCFGADGFPDLCVIVKDGQPHWVQNGKLIRWFE